jgi:hypothetical protein
VLLTPFTTTDPDTGVMEFPAYAWEMNYFMDGTPGGPIRFEIDNTALHVWSTVAHAGALQGADRASFIAAVWPATKTALGLLERWRDPSTGLPWPANEDDSFNLTSTLHGATAVYTALSAGARLALAAGDLAYAQELSSRADALKAATLTAYYDAQSGLFRDTPQMGVTDIPGTSGLPDTAWLAWPARLLDESDPRLEAQLSADLAAVMPDIRGQTEGGAYVMKNVVAAALLGQANGSRATAAEAVSLLANIATPDTMQFGEVFVTTHPNGSTTPVFSARVAPPHVWEGMLFYLSAMALSTPERFDPQITNLPLPPPPAPAQASGGCGCRASGGGASGAALLGLALAACLARRRRARGTSWRGASH